MKFTLFVWLTIWEVVCIPAYKDKQRGTWYASFYYTDWHGDRRQKRKRGFARKKDAEEYEREFLRKGSQSCNMNFVSLVELYLDDMKPRLRETTMQIKKCIIEERISPFFKSFSVDEITPAHVRKWQASLLTGNLSQTYIKTINNQLSAIFNYAVRYYGLRENPARVAGSVGKSKAGAMKFWTVDQFNAFIVAVEPFQARVGLSTLFWTGMRIGELLGLTVADVDLNAKTISITKSFQYLNKQELITEPKTSKSKRTVQIPVKLGSLLQSYIDTLYEPQPEDRLFPYRKTDFYRWMEAGCKKAGVEKIRLHDLRHSHASMLINLGYPAILVSERLGHEDIQTTLQTYGHLYDKTTSKAVEEMDKMML